MSACRPCWRTNIVRRAFASGAAGAACRSTPARAFAKTDSSTPASFHPPLPSPSSNPGARIWHAATSRSAPSGTPPTSVARHRVGRSVHGAAGSLRKASTVSIPAATAASDHRRAARWNAARQGVEQNLWALPPSRRGTKGRRHQKHRCPDRRDGPSWGWSIAAALTVPESRPPPVSGAGVLSEVTAQPPVGGPRRLGSCSRKRARR